MSDPLSSLFGKSSLDLFRSPELFATHGPLERLPAFMYQGPLASTEALCRSYAGPLEVSKGSAAEGVQTPVSGAHAATLLRLGLTVYFPELRRQLPEAHGWLLGLEGALGLPECSSFSAFANAARSGLPLHHDRFDQLLFQIRGEKQFRHRPNGFVRQPDVPFTPLSALATEWGQTYRDGFPLTTGEVIDQGLETLTLQPGSALFMPAGTWHTTADQTGDALSVVVVVRAPSRLMLLTNLLRYYAGQSEAFRARPYGGFSSEPAISDNERVALGELLVDLGERLKRLPADEAFKAWSVNGHLENGLAYPRGMAFSRYMRLPSSQATFEAGHDDAHVLCLVRSGPATRPQNEAKLHFHAHARRIVEWILKQQKAFSLSQLSESFPDYGEADLGDFMQKLGEAGLIRPLPVSDWT